MISIIIPTKGRVQNLIKVFKSLNDTVYNPNDVEVVFYVDRDDDDTKDFFKNDADKHIKFIPTSVVVGDKVNLAETYNRAYKKASGDIIMYSADDVMFRTKHWDVLVREEFDRYEDDICLVFGADGVQPIGTLATHGFLTRKAIDILGYVHPPEMGYNYSDNWLTDIYRKIDRMCYTPVYFEHCHWGVGKAEYDDTYRTGSDAPHDDSISLWREEDSRRDSDVEKLRSSMRQGPVGNSNPSWINVVQGRSEV